MIHTHNRLLTDIFHAALGAANPYECVSHHVGHISRTFREGGFERLFLVSFGKAAYLMAKAVSDQMRQTVSHGMVITKYGHMQEAPLSPMVELFEAGHPVPDENGLAATGNVLDLLKSADANTLVLCLISGGGSALFVDPCPPVTLAEKQEVTTLLLKAGAGIEELNAVRKHISLVKGGRLAELAYPARLISLILSDVIGDRLDVIASGPTAPDDSTFSDALEVIRKYGLPGRIPASVMNLLDCGAAGRLPETPKQGNPIFDQVENIIVGSNGKATEAARKTALEMGFDTTVLSSELQGEARVIAKELAAKAKEVARSSLAAHPSIRPICLIFGGETTVTVSGEGKGGRNTELALAFALEVEGLPGITLLSAGTDGTDGPTDAAGAFADWETAGRARSAGHDPEKYLANNDSYNFFRETGGLFVTGPTGTNVMDLQIILIEPAGMTNQGGVFNEQQ
ncbi:MAG: glycerate kinase [Desulfuromonadaceae bacterium]|nr:glycerate kinase [Desulfuromonadaceae bacterium]